MQALHDPEEKAADGLFGTRGTELSVDSDRRAMRPPLLRFQPLDVL
jgi:hypothetical protein